MSFNASVVSKLLFMVFTVTLSSQMNVFAQDLIFDSFESRDMSTTSVDGFLWGSNNSTSIVTQDSVDGPVAVYNNGSIYNVASPIMADGSVRDWSVIEGGYGLRFRYGSGLHWAEQRFDLGVGYPEIWIRFWLRVPLNFKHNTGNTNNKLLAIWMDDYEFQGFGPTVVWQYRNDGNNGSTTMYYKIRNTGYLNNNNGQRHSGELQSHAFITYPSDQGRWMQVVFHIKSSSSVLAADGIVEMYRRWQSENSFTLLHQELNVPLLHVAGSGLNGFKQGYLMGWANAPYENDTEWLLDGFSVSENSLLSLTTDLIFINGFDANN